MLQLYVNVLNSSKLPRIEHRRSNSFVIFGEFFATFCCLSSHVDIKHYRLPKSQLCVVRNVA